MLLPSDDSYALDDSDDGPLCIDRNDPLPSDLPSLYQFLPAFARGGTSELRDAWLQTWVKMANTSQARAGFVLQAQASPRFGEGIWLDAFGELIGKPRVAAEEDPDYRARLLSVVDLVSPVAIKAAVDAQIAAVSSETIIYNEPAIDAAHCGPATTSDDIIPHSAQQTIGTLQDWFAFTQPQIPQSGVASINQTIYDSVNVRLWATYTGLTGNKTGAFVTPVNIPQFWIIIPGNIEDDSLAPHSEPIALSTNTSSTNGFDIPDFVQGIDSATTPNQSSVLGNPSQTPYDVISYGYIPKAYDSLFDKINIEVTRRKAGGVNWIVMIDFTPQNSF